MDIKPFADRKIDILFFEKFADSDRRNQSEELVRLFNNEGKKLLRLKYGNYTKDQIYEISNDSKFIIYFSFYDTGAIGLKEIQNFGVFAFTLQKDLAIHNKTSLYIPELENIDNMQPAFNIIIQNMKNISDSNPNTEIMARFIKDYFSVCPAIYFDNALRNFFSVSGLVKSKVSYSFIFSSTIL